jgi:hypothetical protein
LTFHFPPPPPEPSVVWIVRRPEARSEYIYVPRYLTSFRFGTNVRHVERWSGFRDRAHEFTSRPLARACAIALGASLIKVTRRPA